jgi:hypothetical protein
MRGIFDKRGSGWFSPAAGEKSEDGEIIGRRFYRSPRKGVNHRRLKRLKKMNFLKKKRTHSSFSPTGRAFSRLKDECPEWR